MEKKLSKIFNGILKQIDDKKNPIQIELEDMEEIIKYIVALETKIKEESEDVKS